MGDGDDRTPLDDGAVGLRGRGPTCRFLADRLREATERAVVVLAEGEPGSGKSTLCRETADRARRDGFRVITMVGIQGESDIALAALSALLRPLLPDAASLPEKRRRAVHAVTGASDDEAPDRFALGVAVLGLFAAVTERVPLLIVIDDAHWLDQLSADVLSFVARRLGDDPVMLLAATRPGPCPLVLEGAAVPLAVGPLDLPALACVLDDAGYATSPEVLRAIEAVSGGLPLAALETAAALSAAHRAGNAPLPDPLPVGRRVGEAYRRRLDSLPDRTLEALAVVVAAGTAPPTLLEAGLATDGLSIVDLEPAEDAGILRLAADGTVVFGHPLLRAAAFAVLTPSVRRRAQRALAAVTAPDAVDADAERHARHLLGAAFGPEDELADALDAAGRALAHRAGPAGAADVLGQAAEMTPPGPRRVARHLVAAQACLAAGLPARARRHAGEVLVKGVDATARCDAHLVMLATAVWGPEGTARAHVAAEEAERIREADPARAVRLLVPVCSVAMSHGALPEALDLARRGRAWAGDDRVDAPTGRSASQLCAMSLVLSGRHAEARSVLDGLPDEPPSGSTDLPGHAQTLVRLERLGEAERSVREQLAAGGRDDAPSARAHALACAGEVYGWQGRWAEALAAGDEAVDLAHETGEHLLGLFARGDRAWLDAARGNDRRCRDDVGTVLAGEHEMPAPPLRIYALAALGLLELGRDDLPAAVAALLGAEDRRQELSCYDPRAVPFGPDLVEALARSGDLDGARRVLDRFDGLVEASDTAWARATSARCHALLADPDAADDWFLRAMEHHARSSPFDRARTQLCWGRHLRRRRDIRASRSVLREARTTFAALGRPLDLGRGGRAAGGGGATAIRRAGRPPRAEPAGVAVCARRRGRDEQPGGGLRTLPQPEDRRVPPAQGLREAPRDLPDAARACPVHPAQRVGSEGPGPPSARRRETLRPRGRSSRLTEAQRRRGLGPDGAGG
ncbi:AAA family ATPase [Actinomycetospora chiangmaiensis]|uniref:AAA family ATPase n=1 Tax=Actinomycetospora chiangmaiensis TaxID=402650 RepID=UPI0004759335|nr:ATP-binding protein [Actinomycetospora chiangmaiensis]